MSLWGMIPCMSDYPLTRLEFLKLFLMRQPAPSIWSASGGQKVSNAHTVVRLVFRIVFRPGRACLNMSSMPPPNQPYNGHRYAPNTAATPNLVLGCVLGDDTDTWCMSALQFQRQLGIRRYETAFQILHKLRTAMVRHERDQIGAKWRVDVDETYVGGATQGEGRGDTTRHLLSAL